MKKIKTLLPVLIIATTLTSGVVFADACYDPYYGTYVPCGAPDSEYYYSDDDAVFDFGVGAAVGYYLGSGNYYNNWHGNNWRGNNWRGGGGNWHGGGRGNWHGGGGGNWHGGGGHHR